MTDCSQVYPRRPRGQEEQPGPRQPPIKSKLEMYRKSYACVAFKQYGGFRTVTWL